MLTGLGGLELSWLVISGTKGPKRVLILKAWGAVLVNVLISESSFLNNKWACDRFQKLVKGGRFSLTNIKMMNLADRWNDGDVPREGELKDCSLSSD